jgi:hypothetical protein
MRANARLAYVNPSSRVVRKMPLRHVLRHRSELPFSRAELRLHLCLATGPPERALHESGRELLLLQIFGGTGLQGGWDRVQRLFRP